MDARLREFAELLRQNGVRVGPGELADAMQAAVLVGLDERETLRAALRTCMVKRGADAATFDRVFGLYFSGAARMLEQIEGSLLAAIEGAGFLEGDELAMVVATLRRLVGEMSPLARATVEGDRAALARLFREAALRIDFSGLTGPGELGFYTRRLAAWAGVDRARTELTEIERALAAAGVSPEGLEWTSQRRSAALRGGEDAARQMGQREAIQRTPKTRQGPSADRAFVDLSREELERTSVAVRRLAERLKTRLVRRQRVRRKGSLNVRRTLRRNLGWGGLPMRLAFRSRRPERPDLVVLCDVSASVRNVARVMLLFVHTLQALYGRVRTFVFVNDLGEVTASFRGVDPREALEHAVAGHAVSLAGNSNYGRVFDTFVKDHLGPVSRRTTVLVIGDGRGNYNPTGLPSLKDIKRRARRLLWICPEPRRLWGSGDSEMRLYETVCDRVAVVESLSDLSEVADALLPKG